MDGTLSPGAVNMAYSQTIGRYYLFELPQELQDVVSTHAYPAVPRLRLTFKEDWKMEQQNRRKLYGSSSVGGTFKTLKVEEWLVSKRYLLSAASAWIGNQSLDASSARWSILRYDLQLTRNGSGLFREFCTCLTLDYLFMETSGILHCITTELSLCRKLRDLTILIDHRAFAAIKDKYPFEIAFEDAELQLLVRRLGLDALRGLRILTLEPRETQYANTEAKMKTFAENVRRLEQIAWTGRSTQPRKLVKDNKALYYGSKVRTSDQMPTSNSKSLRLLQHISETYGLALDMSDSESDDLGPDPDEGDVTDSSTASTPPFTWMTTAGIQNLDADSLAEALQAVVSGTNNHQDRKKKLKSFARARLGTQSVTQPREDEKIGFLDALLEDDALIPVLVAVFTLACLAFVFSIGRQ